MIANRFLKNTSWLLFGKIFQMIIQFFIGIISARYLGPANFGTISYVSSFITFFASIVLLGLNGVLINELVLNHNREGEIVGTAIFLRFTVGIVSTVLLYIIIILTEGPKSEFLIIALLMSIQLPLYAFDSIGYWFQSQLLSKKVVIIQSIAFLVVACYKIYILVSKKPVTWFAFSGSLNIFLMAGLYFIIYKKASTQKLRFSKEFAIRLLKQCFPFLLETLMVQIYAQTDKIMIRNLLGSVREVGIYTACTTICGLIGFIPVAIIDSGRPVIMELKARNDEMYELRLKQLIAAVSWISILYSLFITLFSYPILYILYGKEFISGNLCLKIVVWYTAFSFLGGIRSIWLICENKNIYVFWLSMLGAITNIILNFFLITRYGINGAAFATFLTQLLSNLLYPMFFKETRRFSLLAFDSIFLRNIDLKGLLKYFRYMKNT